MKYTVGLFLLIAITVGIWYVTPHKNELPQASASPAVSASVTPMVTATQATGTFTVAQVATHNSGASCYTIIRSNVYDLTSWIRQHPGGPGAVLGLCGKDGTAAFEGQHDGKPQQENILATFKIGVVVN